MKKSRSIESGTPFDTLLRGLVQVPKDEFEKEEKKFKAASKAKRAKGKKK